MKAWEIVGWAHDGAVYCDGCADPPVNEQQQEQQGWHPLFAGDEGVLEMVCDECSLVIADTL